MRYKTYKVFSLFFVNMLTIKLRKFWYLLFYMVHWKDWCWRWSSSTLATWCEELAHLKRLWDWKRLRAGEKGDIKGWDGWMASPTQWTWVWMDSESWWWTGKPGMLRFMGSQRVGHSKQLNWNEALFVIFDSVSHLTWTYLPLGNAEWI